MTYICNIKLKETIMEAEYQIDKVVIDVKAGEIIIADNGKDIPTQTIKFTEEDEWFSIKDRKGAEVLDGNIWWDEQWGFQYVGFMEQADEKTGKGYITNDGDYRNPELVSFMDGDKTPFYELAWVKKTLQEEFQWRAVMKDGDGVMSIPIEAINVEERHDVINIGLYRNVDGGTQIHILDVSHRQIKQWNGLFMDSRNKKS